MFFPSKPILMTFIPSMHWMLDKESRHERQRRPRRAAAVTKTTASMKILRRCIFARTTRANKKDFRSVAHSSSAPGYVHDSFDARGEAIRQTTPSRAKAAFPRVWTIRNPSFARRKHWLRSQVSRVTGVLRLHLNLVHKSARWASNVIGVVRFIASREVQRTKTFRQFVMSARTIITDEMSLAGVFYPFHGRPPHWPCRLHAPERIHPKNQSDVNP